MQLVDAGYSGLSYHASVNRIGVCSHGSQTTTRSARTCSFSIVFFCIFSLKNCLYENPNYMRFCMLQIYPCSGQGRKKKNAR